MKINVSEDEVCEWVNDDVSSIVGRCQRDPHSTHDTVVCLFGIEFTQLPAVRLNELLVCFLLVVLNVSLILQFCDLYLMTFVVDLYKVNE